MTFLLILAVSLIIGLFMVLPAERRIQMNEQEDYHHMRQHSMPQYPMQSPMMPMSPYMMDPMYMQRRTEEHYRDRSNLMIFVFAILFVIALVFILHFQGMISLG